MSKLVTDREKSARAVVAAAESHAAAAGGGVRKLLASALKSGEKMPDLELMIALVGRTIGSTSKRLTEADAAHERELGDDAGPREERDEAAAEVRSLLVDLRAAVDTVYGPTGLRKLGIDAAVPSDPSVLASLGARVREALVDKKVKLPKARRGGLNIDRGAFASGLETHLPKLKSALKSTAKEAREADETLRGKQTAQRDYDLAFSRGAAWLSATFALAGLDELAGKVRPSGRRPGQVTEQPSDEDPTGGSEVQPTV
jgi:hypothetical protein